MECLSQYKDLFTRKGSCENIYLHIPIYAAYLYMQIAGRSTCPDIAKAFRARLNSRVIQRKYSWNPI